MTNHRSPSTSRRNQSPSNFSSLPPLPPPPPSLAPPPPPPPSSPPPPPPPPEDEDDERAFKKEEERVHTEYRTMASLGLPVQFSSTKGKQVEGADVSGARIIKKRRYRQYMNRKGGFNRPLDGGIM